MIHGVMQRFMGAVMRHSEFGRMPISQRGLGHNPGAMTIFLTGGGIP